MSVTKSTMGSNSASTSEDVKKEEINIKFTGNPFNSDMIITSGYGSRFLGYTTQFHYGLDLVPTKQNKNTLLYAISDCEVINSYYGVSEGNCVVMKVDNDYLVYYLHLRQSYVNNGQKLKKGDVVGVMGSTGYAFGEHLHFECCKGDTPFRNRIDPITFLDKKYIVNYSEYYK